MRLAISVALWLLLIGSATAAQPENAPVVRAVLFWMRTCPHCHEVITNVLPPLQEKYGAQLDILFVEVETRQDFERLYAVGGEFGLARWDIGVPFLVIGDRVLIGSLQIPAELPRLIEEHLAAGGVDFPRIPALADVLPPPEPEQTLCTPETPCHEEISVSEPSEPADPPALEQEPAVHEEHPLPSPSEVKASSQELPSEAGFSRGFELAIAVLIGMILTVIYGIVQIIRVMQGAPVGSSSRWRDGVLIALSVLGMAVAGYLAYVETQAVAAFCGPVGDCNTVQSSPYAKLFGVLFSIYLTYLEPFVIRAICIWCVSSAIIMTLLMLLSLRPALHVVREYSDAAQRISQD